VGTGRNRSGYRELLAPNEPNFLHDCRLAGLPCSQLVLTTRKNMAYVGGLLVRRQGGPRSQVARTGISSLRFLGTSKTVSFALEMTRNPTKAGFCRCDTFRLRARVRSAAASIRSGINRIEAVGGKCNGFRPPNQVLPTRLCSSNLQLGSRNSGVGACRSTTFSPSARFLVIGLDF
jgi:hypothetical protein